MQPLRWGARSRRHHRDETRAARAAGSDPQRRAGSARRRDCPAGLGPTQGGAGTGCRRPLCGPLAGTGGDAHPGSWHRPPGLAATPRPLVAGPLDGVSGGWFQSSAEPYRSGGHPGVSRGPVAPAPAGPAAPVGSARREAPDRPGGSQPAHPTPASGTYPAPPPYPGPPAQAIPGGSHLTPPPHPGPAGGSYPAPPPAPPPPESGWARPGPAWTQAGGQDVAGSTGAWARVGAARRRLTSPPAGGTTRTRPANYFWPSLVCLFLFLPSALVAVVYSTQVNRRVQVGDMAGAVRASRLARTWCLVTVIVFGALVVWMMAGGRLP